MKITINLAALALSLTMAAAQAQTPLTQAEQTQAGQEAAEFARDEHAGASAGADGMEFVEGAGEKGAGQVKFDGRTVDVNKLNPGADKSKADGLNNLSESGQNFDTLKQKSDEQDTFLATDRGAEGQAWRTFERSSYRAKNADQQLKDDQAFWDATLPALREGREGLVNGEAGPQCNSTTQVETRPSTAFIEDEYTCERVQDYSIEPLCSREYTEETQTVTYDQEKRALLGVDTGTSGQICRRERFVTSHRDTLSQSRAEDLQITTEQAGLSCRRYRWAEQITTAVTRSKDATLAINDEMGGLSCTRYIQVTSSTGTQAGSMNHTLNVNNEQGGLSCQRYRWVTNTSQDLGIRTATLAALASHQLEPIDYDHNLASYMPPGTTSISEYTQTMSGGDQHCFILQPGWIAPSLQNGWVATYSMVTPAEPDFSCRNARVPSVLHRWRAHASARAWEVRETGNCADPGTAACPTVWSCSVTAPTTINGIAVSSADVGSLAPLYTGAPGACTTGNLTRTCGGSATTSNTVSIAALLPAGTTAITGFGFTVNNPQSGVTVSLTQTPSAANSWVARFNVTRSFPSATPAAPQITMTWNANYPVTSSSIVESGNCSDAGSAVCPAQWTCTANAPTTINGGSVTVAIAQSEAPLFPGAPNSCASADLRRVCSGPSTVGTSVSIADLIPAGATTIRNLNFSVLNPQAGVSVSLVTPPTLQNGWLAGFNVTRTSYGTLPNPPQVRITFTVDESSIALSVREEGNCSDPGSTACPTSWSCTQSAPTTINGQAISLAMAQGQPTLYAGAAGACVVGELKRVCNGTSAISTQIPIGDLLPAGTTEITNFQWNVTNPQASVTVSLVSAPTLANGWVATYSVVRNYALGGTPALPNVMMTWNVLGPIEYDHSIVTEGDCSGAADGPVSASCQVRWRCLGGLPRQYGTINLTTGMIAGNDDLRLYPNEPWDCAEAVRERHCTGDGSNLTVVDISTLLPPGTQLIRSYGWEVLGLAQGVAVTQVEAPSLANGWKGTFRTTRTDWTVTPTQPEVRLHWQVDAQSTGHVVVDTGDCALEGDEFCDAEWRCVEEFPPTTGGGVVSPGQKSFLFYTPRYGTSSYVSTSIASLVPAGAQSVANFQMQIVSQSPHSDIVGVVQLPSAQNGWMVLIQDNGVCGNATAPSICDDGFENMVNLTWDNMSDVGPPPAVDPIFPGAPPTCKRAEKFLNCDRINDGEVCHETEQGTICEVVEGGPFDNCTEYREDPACSYTRTVCNEDGWGGTVENPICRIETDVYMCRREVTGEDVIVRETTTCSGEMSACADGSCTSTVTEEEMSESQSMRKAAAHLVIRENMMTDYVVLGSSGGGGTGGGGTDPGPPNQQTFIERAGSLGEKVLGGMVATARASNPFDAFKMPSGATNGIPSDPAQYQQAFGNYTAETMRFFDGNKYDCMKALGGLLNCCTKKVDPDNTNKEWWSSFGETLREKWAQNTQCKIDEKPQEEKESGSSFMQPGATPEDLAKGFTGLEDLLKGGGTAPECNQEQPRMEDVMKSFMGTMKSEYFPKLSWYCDSDEKELAALKETGNCTYLGDYCRKKVLGFCIDKRQRHCCFNSPMTRMIREKLRDMGIKGMGSAKSPDCSGVSPQDFAQMNTDELDTGDLEARMLAGGMFPDLASILGGSTNLLELFTGTGSNINDDRVNSLDRTNAQLDGTNPGGAVASIEEIMGGQVTEPSSVTGTVPGDVSFTTGFRSVRHGSLDEKEVRVGVVRNGNAAGVSVSVVAASISASQGVDFTFAPQTLSWGAGDGAVKDVVLRIRKAGRTAPVSLELRLQSPTGGAGIRPTGVIQIDIQPAD